MSVNKILSNFLLLFKSICTCELFKPKELSHILLDELFLQMIDSQYVVHFFIYIFRHFVVMSVIKCFVRKFDHLILYSSFYKSICHFYH